MPVLRPLSVEELQNIFTTEAVEIINYFIKKSIFSQPESKLWQDLLPFQVPKEHIEQWFVQALDAQWIWAWSYPVDIVKSSSRWGADVKMLSAKVDRHWKLRNNDSWETSLAQKFSGTWSILDTLFKEEKFEQIKTEWLDIYKEKLLDVYNEQEIDKIYYFILLRWWNKFYLVWMEVNLSGLADVTIDRSSKSSIYLKNFIPDNYGNTKIYKAKKRLELRLTPKNWEDEERCMVFDFDEKIRLSKKVNLFEMLQNEEDINEHWQEEASKIFS